MRRIDQPSCLRLLARWRVSSTFASQSARGTAPAARRAAACRSVSRRVHSCLLTMVRSCRSSTGVIARRSTRVSLRQRYLGGTFKPRNVTVSPRAAACARAMTDEIQDTTSAFDQDGANSRASSTTSGSRSRTTQASARKHAPRKTNRSRCPGGRPSSQPRSRASVLRSPKRSQANWLATSRFPRERPASPPDLALSRMPTVAFRASLAAFSNASC